uniref:NADH-ubiquinone oxidoreductase chain 2 n=1 Tax=Adelastes hylonomos TaxID=1658277 RepID=A0A8K1LYY8_9NEOB|nr:NADH dehydrogenase subunit 2 [Adelastes hylonomos]
MLPTTTFIFLSSLAMGTTITLASNHWLLAWIGLEINTLAIIPLMTASSHPRAIEASTKYFLTQSAASALILFSAIINTWAFGEWDISSSSASLSIPLSIAICMKLGLAPMHFWMPEVLQGIPLTTGLILSTWQKIAPMALLLQISHMTNLTLMISLGVISIIIGGWGGINQTQIRKILAFSSIAHMGWIISIIKFSTQLALFNFILYIMMTSALFATFIILNTTKISQLSSTWPKTPTLTATSMLTLLSLAGLPPLTGFAPKLLTSLELVKQHNQILAASLLLASLLTLFFYIRLTYVLILILPPNTPPSKTAWRHKMNQPTISSFMNTLALLLLPISPSILLLL